jgi:hypothetical protein
MLTRNLFNHSLGDTFVLKKLRVSPNLNYMRKKAVSLLEIVVATVIMVLIMASLSNIFLASKRYILHTRSRRTGGEMGYFFLDPLQKQVRQDNWDTSCLGTGTCPDQITGIAEGLNTDYTAHYEVTPNFGGTTLSKVKVTISWPND